MKLTSFSITMTSIYKITIYLIPTKAILGTKYRIQKKNIPSFSSRKQPTKNSMNFWISLSILICNILMAKRNQSMKTIKSTQTKTIEKLTEYSSLISEKKWVKLRQILWGKDIVSGHLLALKCFHTEKTTFSNMWSSLNFKWLPLTSLSIWGSTLIKLLLTHALMKTWQPKWKPLIFTKTGQTSCFEITKLWNVSSCFICSTVERMLDSKTFVINAILVPSKRW